MKGKMNSEFFQECGRGSGGTREGRDKEKGAREPGMEQNENGITYGKLHVSFESECRFDLRRSSRQTEPKLFPFRNLRVKPTAIQLCRPTQKVTAVLPIALKQVFIGKTQKHNKGRIQEDATGVGRSLSFHSKAPDENKFGAL